MTMLIKPSSIIYNSRIFFSWLMATLYIAINSTPYERRTMLENSEKSELKAVEKQSASVSNGNKREWKSSRNLPKWANCRANSFMKLQQTL